MIKTCGIPEDCICGMCNKPEQATPCNSELEARLRCVIEHLEVVANYHDAGLEDVGEHIFKACRDIAAVANEL